MDIFFLADLGRILEMYGNRGYRALFPQAVEDPLRGDDPTAELSSGGRHKRSTG
ncbi:MAG: hypothetical protein H0X25_02230 [Acidobacteriales bacterium]|nr:hypothetical protein [Terriglobales bacterium]